MRYAALRQPTEATAVFVGVDAEDKSTLAKASAQATQVLIRCCQQTLCHTVQGVSLR